MKKIAYMISGVMVITLVASLAIYLSLSKEIRQEIFPQKGMYDAKLLKEVEPGMFRPSDYELSYFGRYVIKGLVDNPDEFLAGIDTINESTTVDICIKKSNTSGCDYLLNGHFRKYDLTNKYSYSIGVIRVCKEDGCVAQGAELDYVNIDSPISFKELYIKKVSDL